MRPATRAATLLSMDLPAGLRMRPLAPEDAESVFDLMVLSETHDLGEPAIDLEDIVGDWQRPSFDIRTQSVGVQEDGRLVGYAEVYQGRYADATVPPAYRGRGIGTAVARWTQAEARRQGGTIVGMPVPQGSDGDRLLAAMGYRVAWSSWILELPIGVDIEPQPLPDGYRIRAMAAGEERQAYRLVEDAFNEWPDRTPQSFEDWAAASVLRPGFDRSHLLFVEDQDGVTVGVSLLVMSRECGYVQQLAVRKDLRGRGLARGLLVQSFARARELGATRSELSTDSRTGALGLYERVGMVVTSTWLHRAIEV